MNYIYRRWKIIAVLIIISPTFIFILTHQKQKPNQQHAKEIISKNDKWILTRDSDVTYNKDTDSDWSIIQLHSDKRCSPKIEDLKESFLTAFKHGAKYIYICDQIQRATIPVLDKCFYGQYMSVLQYNGSSLDPISLHFYDNVKIDPQNRANNSLYHLGVWKTSVIQKIMAGSIKTTGVPFLLPYNVFNTLSTDNLLFHYDAFWSVAMLRGDYLWSIWTQKLMQEIGTSVLYLSGLDYSAAHCSKLPENQTIIQQLQSWTCKERSSFFTCVLSLTNFMVEKHIIYQHEYEKVAEWLEILLRNGYEQPKLSMDNKESSLEPTYRVLYEPTDQKPLNNLNKTYKIICKKSPPKCPNATLSENSLKKLNILLVIVYNRPGHYKSIQYLESIYRPVFKHILYCGTNISDFLITYNKMNKPVSFLEQNPGRYANGEQGYLCLQHAIRMNYDVEGFFHVGEDVLLNIWNLHHMPTDKIWFQQSMRPASLSQPTVPCVWKNPSWWPWNSGRGQGAIQRAINTIVNLSQKDSLAKKFLDTLAKNAGGSNRVFYEVSDIFYIPQVLAQEFLYFVNVFETNNGYIEIVIPTIINGLVDKSNIHIINGSYLWYGERIYYRETFSYKNMFLHPIKTGLCFPDKDCLQFMCDRYLPCVINNLKNL